ncbi:MAG: glucose-6-phosphate isomerase family protein [Patescibacteria group bacterium]
MEKQLKNPDIRYIEDMKDVIYDQDWLESVENFEVYYMYRGVDKKNGLRYDITEIPFRMFGKEYPKTKGHYHPGDYGEIYQVLEGRAIYLLQDKNAEDIVAIETNPGEVAIIPPGYGHITINPGPEKLKMANWVSPEFDSLYEPVLEKEGAGYFYTTEGWVKNKNYKNLPEIKEVDPEKELPEDLEFLKNK